MVGTYIPHGVVIDSSPSTFTLAYVTMRKCCTKMFKSSLQLVSGKLNVKATETSYNYDIAVTLDSIPEAIANSKVASLSK